ncbi:serine/threonine-protein phosphatase [Crossiella sp. SN42]|uniref:PP2C family protein-serine/threonine phosphatase n=1 Tax=Crossiella sp. SN42 TaxID=2944808 RepID=UPI00207D14B0|nr:PP2C family protein-serine/threonine phosphatase [Crossiella sp. SN42]MCO1577264.1 serine/threonine-protein phosphatase [Crossiella sp. SN42]
MDGFRMLAGLLEASHLAGFEQLTGLVEEHGDTAGFTGITILLADLRQETLVPTTGEGRCSVDGSLAGRAFRHIELVVTDDGPGGHHFWLPLLDGTERVGVLGAWAPAKDRATLDRLQALAALVALLVVSKRPHSDTHARLVRSQPMALAAEVVRPLMPPLCFANEDIVVAGVLEPAYEVGGDALDYALTGDTLHVSVFDAMGHDQSAGLTVALATGTCRNSRRSGIGLVETSAAIDSVIHAQFGRSRFTTGVLADLDTRSGLLTWVNRGHPPPLLIRRGRWLSELQCKPTPPMGFGFPIQPRLCRHQLEPGDRLLFYTDGIVEARDGNDVEFGLRRFTDFIIRREADGYSAPETLRRLMRTVLAHQDDHLQDDASVLLLEWRSDRQKRLVVSRGV